MNINNQSFLCLNRLSLFCFFVSIFIFTFSFLYGERKLFALNPASFRDIALKIPSSGWIFPPSPYFFPDGMVFAFTKSFASSYLLALAISGVIISVFVFSGWLILSILFPSYFSPFRKEPEKKSFRNVW